LLRRLHDEAPTPAGQRATRLALMASLMNLALVAGQLQTKFLSESIVVQRGDYSELVWLLITASKASPQDTIGNHIWSTSLG
jgi:hypothetical protein